MWNSTRALPVSGAPRCPPLDSRSSTVYCMQEDLPCSSIGLCWLPFGISLDSPESLLALFWYKVAPQRIFYKIELMPFVSHLPLPTQKKNFFSLCFFLIIEISRMATLSSLALLEASPVGIGSTLKLRMGMLSVSERCFVSKVFSACQSYIGDHENK